MQINELIAILRARWRLIVATILTVVAVAAIITLQTPSTYQAHTRVYLSAVGDAGTVNMYQMPSAELDTILEVAQSPVVLDPVREELGLAPGQILGVSAQAETGTPLIDITVQARTAQASSDVATAVAVKLAEVSPDFSQMLAQSGGEIQAQTIVAATPPGSPISPDVTRNLALALLAGLFLGIGFALLRHNLDTRVRTAKDLADMTERPVLASIPMRKANGANHMFMETDPFSPHSEAIRRLRTNLMFVDVTTRKHSFLVTSPMPSEGKTTTAVNLALAMADAGTKVVLVDADLRNPSVATTMGLEGGVGLTTVLLGRASLDEMLVRWGESDLYVLPAGEIPPNPSELLGSEAMRDLFTQLSERFDFVLVDTPPVLPVTDAMVVDKLVGGSLMVIAANRTRKRHVLDALRTFETSGATLAGTALNMAPTESVAYYGYYRQEHPPEVDEQESNPADPARPRAAARSRSRR